MKKLIKTLSLLLAAVMIFGLLPVAALADCSHNWVRKYTIENENKHSYVSHCTRCGEDKSGWGYSGWEDHSYTNGVCVCGYRQKCQHTSTKTEYKYENGNQHSYWKVCKSCGEELYGTGYSGWESHTLSGNTCTKCGYTKACTHSSSTRKYSNTSSTQHKTWLHCNSCGIDYNT